MSKKNEEYRHSVAIFSSEGSSRETTAARNLLRQFDYASELIRQAIIRNSFDLSVSTILEIHAKAFVGLSPHAGKFRREKVLISGSDFVPPSAEEVQPLVEEMCAYVNDNWRTATALHLAAYILWRLNWIHPFVEGNGATARVTSFIVLSVKLGSEIPGVPTVPEGILLRRSEYFRALEAADLSYREARAVDVSKLEELLSTILIDQLTTMYEATGRKLPT